MTETWPKPLREARGPIRAAKLDGAAEGMGEWGRECRALAADGLVPPDMLTAMTLFILSSQPRDPEKKQAIPGGGGGVAGGVWVRERYTIHRPLRRDEVFTVRGNSEGRHVHKARRYGTTSSETFNAAGERVATNLTTGLLSYKVQDGLADGVEGRAPDDIPSPRPDWSVAANNPCRDALGALQVGQALGGYPVTVSLALMEARDTKNPDNPIHSDPELARKAGLSKPIAGGSHVLSFALEPILQAVGRQALLHGAAFDIRWKAPVYADRVMTPHARVAAVGADRVVFDVDAVLDDGATAMTGQITVPLA
ncbi:MAG: MaoC family dehydratase [Pseudomonadales bacterium]|nr:MaoC family dehydratase [Pseudomonadales bacterium]MCP5183609.1 MaoC family dehydratase [Pseudomonadales bacterium]